MENESRLSNQPKYKIGQCVKFEVETQDKESGTKFSNTVKALISVIRAAGTDISDTYEYGVTLDMPGCYHSGKPPFKYILQNNIHLCQ